MTAQERADQRRCTEPNEARCTELSQSRSEHRATLSQVIFSLSGLNRLRTETGVAVSYCRNKSFAQKECWSLRLKCGSGRALVLPTVVSLPIGEREHTKYDEDGYFFYRDSGFLLRSGLARIELLVAGRGIGPWERRVRSGGP